MELLITPAEIAKRLSEVARSINEEYKNQELTIVLIMKGALCIGADLIQHLQIPFTLEYMSASSYGQRGTQNSEVKISGMEKFDLSSKNILVVDDIFDTGNTMVSIIALLQKQGPKSLKTLVLLSKKVIRKTSYRPDYSLFEIENHFVVGYGLDYKEHFRGLPGIYILTNL